MAIGNRLTLILMGQVLARPQMLCAAVTTEREAHEHLDQHRPGLLICSDPLEEGEVASLCRQACERQPQLRVLLILPSSQRASQLSSLHPLVDALLLEEDLGGDDYPLMKAFIALAQQRRYRSPSLRMVDEAAGPEPTAQLTPRERHILDLLSEGLGDREIAAALGLSYETVRTYVKSVRRKLGVSSRVMAARWRWGQGSGR